VGNSEPVRSRYPDFAAVLAAGKDEAASTRLRRAEANRQAARRSRLPEPARMRERPASRAWQTRAEALKVQSPRSRRERPRSCQAWTAPVSQQGGSPAHRAQTRKRIVTEIRGSTPSLRRASTCPTYHAPGCARSSFLNGRVSPPPARQHQ